MLRDNEKFFIEKIDQGILVLYSEGKLYNTKTNRFVGSYCPTVRYPRYMIKENKSTIRIFLHRLNWVYHNGPVPIGYEVNHKDCNRLNWCLTNLELLTPSENVKHAADNITTFHYGENNHISKISNADVIKYRQLYKNGEITVMGVANALDIGRTTAYNMLKGNTYTRL